MNPEERIVDCDATDRYESHVTRRAIGEPVAYILGEKEFWSLTLAVTPDVLVPRPETELVVERALAHLADGVEERRVLDLATGSGAIALAIAHERPPCRYSALTYLPPRLRLLRRMHAGSAWQTRGSETGSWYEPVGEERFDVITCNPPYVADGDASLAWQVRRHEPHQALYAGPTGLEALQTVIAGASVRLLPAGWLVVEHGATQGEAVRALFGAAGLREVTTFRDLAGHERCCEGTRLA